MTDAELYFYKTAVISLAGKIAEERARRGSEPGWVKHLSEARRLAIHEAGHAIVAASLSQYVHRVSIVPHPELKSRSGMYFLGGYCLHSDKPEIQDDRAPEEFPTKDHSHVALAALALSLTLCPNEMPDWMAARKIIRLLKQATASLVDQHWFLISALASELERSKEIDRVAVERFTNRVPAACVDFSSLGSRPTVGVSPSTDVAAAR